MRFLDANMTVGRPRVPGIFRPLATPGELSSHLRESGIAGGLVRHFAQADDNPITANPLLAPFTEGQPGTAGCLALLPPLSDPLIGRDFFRRSAGSSCKALSLYPADHRYLLNRVVWGSFADEVSERRIPVFLSLEHTAGWAEIYGFLADYPRLTLILADVGSWSSDRYAYPLLDAYPNVVIETSMAAIEDGGMEGIVTRFGAQRLVFGTGFPVRYVEAAMLALTHADLSPDDKKRIAADNLEAMLARGDWT